jgi:threonine synthase
MFNCPHTGVALAVLVKLVERGDVRPADRVVIISTANGLKFTDFKLRYHESALPMPSHFANRPVEVDDDYDQVRRVIDGAAATAR